jgi:hypothetical protein
MLTQGLAPEDRDLAIRAKTPGPGVIAKINMISKNDTAFSRDIETLLLKLLLIDFLLLIKSSISLMQGLFFHEDNVLAHGQEGIDTRNLDKVRN